MLLKVNVQPDARASVRPDIEKCSVGKPFLYGCPFAHRVLLFCKEKGQTCGVCKLKHYICFLFGITGMANPFISRECWSYCVHL